MPKPHRQAYEYWGHPYPVRIVFASTPSAWHATLAHYKIDEPYPDTHGRATLFTHPNHNALSIITLSQEAERRSSTQVIGLMTHELTHVIQHIEEVIGCRLDAETEAYLQQALLQWLIESYAAAGRSFTDAPATATAPKETA